MSVVAVFAIPFSFGRKEARWILLGSVAGMVGTFIAYQFFGYTRMLGIGHVVAWTPTLLYIWSLRDRLNIKTSWFGKWVMAWALVMLISLIFDYAGVIRWLFGDRALIG